MNMRLKCILNLCFCIVLFSSSTRVVHGQKHDSEKLQIDQLSRLKSSGLAKNLWQVDRRQSTSEKIHKLLPVLGSNLCHAIIIHHVVLNFIDGKDYLRVVLPDSDALYVQYVHRTESRYGIAQWSGKIVGYDDLIFSLYFDPVHKSYSGNISLSAQDTWVIHSLNDLTVICKTR